MTETTTAYSSCCISGGGGVMETAAATTTTTTSGISRLETSSIPSRVGKLSMGGSQKPGNVEIIRTGNRCLKRASNSGPNTGKNRSQNSGKGCISNSTINSHNTSIHPNSEISGKNPSTTIPNPLGIASPNLEIASPNPEITGPGPNPDVSGPNPDVSGPNIDVSGSNPDASGPNPDVSGQNPDVSGPNPEITGLTPGNTRNPNSVQHSAISCHVSSSHPSRSCSPGPDKTISKSHTTKAVPNDKPQPRTSRSDVVDNSSPIPGYSRSSGPCVLEPFRHQVAGQSLVFQYDAGTICKSLISRELRVYLTMPDVMKPHVPEYRGVVDIALNGPQASKTNKEEEEAEEDEDNNVGDNSDADDHDEEDDNNEEEEEEEKEDEGRRNGRRGGGGGIRHPLTTQRLLDKVVKHQEHDNVYHFLLLENIVSGYWRPCVLDLKLGTRQHGDDAPSHKARYQDTKCRNTTSALLGVRLCGMKVYQPITGKYVKVDKMEGRNMRENDFRDAMRHFLFNGRRMRRELIPTLLSKLQKLKAAVSDCPSFRFYSSSLLIVYDGRETQCVKCKPGGNDSRSVSPPLRVNGCVVQDSSGKEEENSCEGDERFGRTQSGSVHEKGQKATTGNNMDLSLSSSGDSCNGSNICGDDHEDQGDRDSDADVVVDSDVGSSLTHHEIQFQDSDCGSGQHEQTAETEMQFRNPAGKSACQKHENSFWNSKQHQVVLLAPNSSTNPDAEEIAPPHHSSSSSKESAQQQQQQQLNQQPVSLYCKENISPTLDGERSTDRTVDTVEANSSSIRDNCNCSVSTAVVKNSGVTSLPSDDGFTRCPSSPAKDDTEMDRAWCAGYGSCKEPREKLDEEGEGEGGEKRERRTINGEGINNNSNKKTNQNINYRIKEHDEPRTGSTVTQGYCRCGDSDSCARLVDVRMVDFAHTTHAGLSGDAVVYEGPDLGCLLGLTTLIHTFAEIQDDDNDNDNDDTTTMSDCQKDVMT